MNKFSAKKSKFYVFIGIIVCAVIFIGGYVVHKNLNRNHNLILQIEKTIWEITYYDEILTMSARMSAFTGAPAWEERYRTYELKLDKSIKRAYNLAPTDLAQTGTETTDAANIALINMENQSFELVKAGDLKQAQDILLSENYETEKQLYTQGQLALRDGLEDYKETLGKHHLILIAITDLVSGLGILFIIISVFINMRSLQQSHEQEKLAIEYKRLAVVGKLSAGMAHELNNALQPITGLSEVLFKALSKKDDMDARFIEYSETIHKSARHAKEIIENTLASAKGSQSQLEKWDAIEVFTHAFSLASKALPETVRLQKNLEISGQHDNPVNILVNKTDITQIISNVLKNAAHAMKDTGTITVSLEKSRLKKEEAGMHDMSPGDYIVLIIQDTGCGMDEKTISSIFDPFYTTKDEQSGTGLGLSVAYGIMKQIGGRIDVQSKPDKGSTFSLLFPIAQ